MEKGNISAPSTMVYMVENNGIYGRTIFSHDLLPSYSPRGLPIYVILLCHPSSLSLLFLRPSQQLKIYLFIFLLHPHPNCQDTSVNDHSRVSISDGAHRWKQCAGDPGCGSAHLPGRFCAQAPGYRCPRPQWGCPPAPRCCGRHPGGFARAPASSAPTKAFCGRCTRIYIRLYERRSWWADIRVSYGIVSLFSRKKSH